jgi:hypothetical protein
MNLYQFKNTFDYRHDFDEDETNILRSNWPSIKFYNIPLAWIYPIDMMLFKLQNNIDSIKEIRQDYGHITFILKNNMEQYYEVLSAAKSLIYTIDRDIHNELLAS